MQESQHSRDLTIVEILRDGGMNSKDAVAILERTLSIEDRERLCRELELWEQSERVLTADYSGDAEPREHPVLCSRCSNRMTWNLSGLCGECGGSVVATPEPAEVAS